VGVPFASRETCNKRLPLRDKSSEKLAPHLSGAFIFLDGAKASGRKCLVHCQKGFSRSVAIVLAYLVARQGQRLSEAWAFMKTCHPHAQPNRGFVKQLIDLDSVVHGSASVVMSDFFSTTAKPTTRPRALDRTGRPSATPRPLPDDSSKSQGAFDRHEPNRQRRDDNATQLSQHSMEKRRQAFAAAVRGGRA
jgi:hypothetical protein